MASCGSNGFLLLYYLLDLLDLINARDGLCVSVWIGALVVTMVSGFMTLLEVDDAEASGTAMILYMLRLAVEGMSFCSWVSAGKRLNLCDDGT